MANLKGVSNSTIESTLRSSIETWSRMATATKLKRLRMKVRINKAKEEGASELELKSMWAILGLYEGHIQTLEAEYFKKKEELKQHLAKMTVRTQKQMTKASDSIKAVPSKVKGWFQKKPVLPELTIEAVDEVIELRVRMKEQDARELLQTTDRVVRSMRFASHLV